MEERLIPEARQNPEAEEAAAQKKEPLFPTDISAKAYWQFFLLQMYLLLNILGGNMIQPLLIFAQTKFFNDGHDCVTDVETETLGCKLAAGKVSQVLAITGFINSLLSLVFAPIYGRLSDSIGRRRICMLSISPSIGQNAALFLWAYMDVSLWWYFAWGLIPGFSFTMASAYTADIIPGHHRATFFSWQSAITSLTRMFSAAAAGMFATIQVTSMLAFFIQSLALLWVIFAVPETLAESERKPFDVTNTREVLDVMNFYKQMKIVGRNSVAMGRSHPDLQTPLSVLRS
jgi:MFS family permease